MIFCDSILPSILPNTFEKFRYIGLSYFDFYLLIQTSRYGRLWTLWQTIPTSCQATVKLSTLWQTNTRSPLRPNRMKKPVLPSQRKQLKQVKSHIQHKKTKFKVSLTKIICMVHRCDQFQPSPSIC